MTAISEIFRDGSFVLLPAGKKFPPEQGWPDNFHSFDEASSHNGNVGVKAGNGFIGLDLDKPDAFDGLSLPKSARWKTRPGRYGMRFRCGDVAATLGGLGDKPDRAQFKLYKDGGPVGEIKLSQGAYQVVPPSWKLVDGGRVDYVLLDACEPAEISLSWLLTELGGLGISTKSRLEGAKESLEDQERKARQRKGKRMGGDDGDRQRRYALGALEDEVKELASTSEGDRNDRLNRAAFNLGGYVGPGLLSEAEILDALYTAAMRAGLPQEEIGATLQSGVEAGAQRPRKVPPPKREREGHAEPWEGPTVIDAIKALSGVCDGAKTQDGTGFSKWDLEKRGDLITKALTEGRLSPKEENAAYSIVKKYKKQLKGLGIDFEKIGHILSDVNGGPLGDVGPGISTVIVNAVLASDATLWHNSESEPFITIGKDGHLENHRLGSNASRQWLSQVGYRETERVPGGQSIQDAINVLSGVAGFDGEEHPTYSRLAEHDGAVYIDLGLPDWEAVEVTAAGWSVIPLPPVKFIRSGEMLPMPLPAWCGDWSELRALINAPTDDLWLLTLAWLVQAYWPHGPYAHLVLVGEQGSVKSWMTKVLQRLVDPGKGGVRTKPRDIQSLLIHASWSRVVTIDNFSGVLDGWLSDGLCGLSTGTAAGQRRLYTDYEQAVIEVRRPAIINGIDVVVPRGDLMDRSIFLELPKVEGRKSEAELEAAFLAAWPRIFGLLLDATAEGLKNRGQVTLANPPRMMDFALWVTACEPALPCEPGEIMQYYTQARKDRSLDNVMADAFARAIFQHIRASIPDITAADLLARLSQAEGVAISEPPRGWPRDAARVGTKIRRIAPLLREIGVEISASKSNGRRAFDVVVRDGKGTVRDGKGTVTGTVKTASGGHRDGMDGISVV